MTYGSHSVGPAEHIDREHGRVQIGSAFFEWLTATGLAVLLTAVLVAAGSAVGVATGNGAGSAGDQATGKGNIGGVGGIALLVIVLVAYYCGGHVAGRVARSHGAKQDVMAQLWAVLIAGNVAVVGAVVGAKYFRSTHAGWTGACGRIAHTAVSATAANCAEVDGS